MHHPNIIIKSFSNSLILESTQNIIEASLIRVEHLQSFVAPVQALTQKREVE